MQLSAFFSRTSNKKSASSADTPSHTLSIHPASEWLRKVGVAGFLGLVAIVPLFFLSVNEELFEFNKMLLVYGLTTLILATWISRMIVDKRKYWERTPFDFFIFAFVLSQFASTILSLHPRTSIFGYYTRFNGGLFSTLAYFFLFYATLNTLKPRDVLKVLNVALASGLAVSLYGIAEHFGVSPSCVMLTGQYNASCWIQDVQNRVFATFGQPNWLAAYVAMLLPISIAVLTLQWLKNRSTNPGLYSKNFFHWKTAIKWWGVAISVVTSIALFWTLLFTKSRSGFLAWAGGYGLLLCFFLFRPNKKGQTIHQVALNLRALFVSFVMLGVCTGSILVFGSPFSSPVFSTKGFLPQPVKNPAPETNSSVVVDRLEIGGTDSGEIRKIVWQGAFDIWKRYPVFGSGVETFAYSYYQDRPMAHNHVSEWDFLYNKAHNEFLNIAATTGTVGLVTYVLLHSAILLFFAIKAHSSPAPIGQLLASAFLISGLAFHVTNALGFSTVMISTLYYLLPGLLLVLEHPEITIKVKKNTQLKTGQILGLVGTSVVMLFIWISIFTTWYADFSLARSKKYLQMGNVEQSLQSIMTAVKLSPNEGVFYEWYSKVASQYAVLLAQSNQAELAQDYAEIALNASNMSLRLNPVHMNFFRSRVAVLLTLAQVQPDLLQEALETLKASQKLAPTDPKLVYNQGVVELAIGDIDAAAASLSRAVEMKPNYESARFQYGQALEKQSRYADATEQYQYILDHINPNNDFIRNQIQVIATMSGELSE